MMDPLRSALSLIAIITFQVTYAQTLSGTLFFHYSKTAVPINGVLEAISFPDEQGTTLRTGIVDDMLLDGDTLWVAASDSLISYDASTYQELFAVPAADIRHLSISANGLFTGHSQPPYLRMYSRTDGSFIANIGHPIIDAPPADVEAYGSTGFATYSDTVVAVTLVFQTITHIPTPHPYGGGPSGPGFNTFLTKVGSDILIYVDYATGAPRFSLLALEPMQLTVDSVFHKNYMYSQTAPFYGTGKLFFSSYLMYYDFMDDSLYHYPTFEPLYDIAFDEVSENLFYVDVISSTLFAGPVLQGTTASYNLGSYTFSIHQKGVFHPTTPNGLKQSAEVHEPRVFPNPASDRLEMDFSTAGPKTVRVTNLQGQVMAQFEHAGERTALEVTDWPAGIYFVHWYSDDAEGSTRFVKN